MTQNPRVEEIAKNFPPIDRSALEPHVPGDLYKAVSRTGAFYKRGAAMPTPNENGGVSLDERWIVEHMKIVASDAPTSPERLVIRALPNPKLPAERRPASARQEEVPTLFLLEMNRDPKVAWLIHQINDERRGIDRPEVDIEGEGNLRLAELDKRYPPIGLEEMTPHVGGDIVRIVTEDGRIFERGKAPMTLQNTNAGPQPFALSGLRVEHIALEESDLPTVPSLYVVRCLPDNPGKSTAWKMADRGVILEIGALSVTSETRDPGEPQAIHEINDARTGADEGEEEEAPEGAT